MSRTPLLLLLLTATLAHAGGGPENVLVVVNDESSESVEVAHYYMYKRDIPRHHVVHLSLQPRLWKTLRTFAEYKSLLEDPVRAWRKANPKALITTIVLSRDVPIVAPMAKPADFKPYKVRNKVRNSPPDFFKSTAHLLATMDATRRACRNAMQANIQAAQQRKWRISPYYRTDQSIDPRVPLAADMPLYCVGVLNAFTVADVRKMIDGALEGEAKPARKGKVYLGLSRPGSPGKRGDPRGCYNGAFPGLKRAFERSKFACDIVPWSDTRELLTDRHDVLFYMFGQAGWKPEFPAKNTYLPGSVVDNLTSFALRTASFDPKAKGGQTSMCHFLAAGADAVHGCVREPYTVAFDPYHTHMLRYLAGYALCESFYMSHRLMPWMNIVVGDPLMQPFAQRPTLKELGFRKTAKGFAWQVEATPTRTGATIAEIRCYVDGELRQVVKGASATFELSGFDPAIQRLSAVAVDGSPVKTQGRLSRTPKSIPGDVSGVRFTGVVAGKARFELGQSCSYRWYAPAAKRPFGRGQGTRLDLALGTAPGLRNTVEIWCATDGKEAHVKLFDMDRAVVEEAMKAGTEGMKAGRYADVLRVIDMLDRIQLDQVSRATVIGWRKRITDKAAKEYKAISEKLPSMLQPRHVEQLHKFAALYHGLEVAREARERMKGAVGKLDAAAQPLLDRAQKAHSRKKWVDAIASYDMLIRKYPASTHAVTARKAIAAIKADPAAHTALASNKRDAAAERLWKMAENYRRNGNADLRKSTLEKLVSEYPGTEAAKRAKRALAGQ